MKKRLAIFGFLLIGVLACAEKPLPMEGSHQQQQAQPHADASQPNTPPPCATEVCKENADNAERYAYYKAHPKEYFKTAIAPANLSNWILAGLGMVGVITLVFIKRQADIMESQADIMESQAEDARRSGAEATRIALATAQAAQESAGAASAQIRLMKDRERARLGIRTLDVPEVSGPERILNGMCSLRVCATVENFGHSKAFSVRVFGILDIVLDPESCPREKGFLQYFPQIIDEGLSQHPLKLGGLGRELEDVASSGDFIAVAKEKIREIRDGKVFIQVSGKLAYEDIFGDGHTTPFRFVWKSVGDDDGGKWRTRSFWLDCNPPSDEQDEPE